MQAIQPETKFNSCGICKNLMTQIIGRNNVCTNCKTNLAYLARNFHQPDKKLPNLKLRLLALTILQSSPKMSLSEALRQAIKISKTSKVPENLKIS